MPRQLSLLIVLKRTVGTLMESRAAFQSAAHIVLRLHVYEYVVGTAHLHRAEVALVDIVAHVRRLEMVLHDQGGFRLEVAEFAFLHFEMEGLVVLFAELEILDERVDGHLCFGRGAALALLALLRAQQVCLDVLLHEADTDRHEELAKGEIEVGGNFILVLLRDELVFLLGVFWLVEQVIVIVTIIVFVSDVTPTFRCPLLLSFLLLYFFLLVKFFNAMIYRWNKKINELKN